MPGHGLNERSTGLGRNCRLYQIDLNSEPEKIKLRKKSNREFSVGRKEQGLGCSQGPGEKKTERKVPRHLRVLVLAA